MNETSRVQGLASRVEDIVKLETLDSRPQTGFQPSSVRLIIAQCHDINTRWSRLKSLLSV